MAAGGHWKVQEAKCVKQVAKDKLSVQSPPKSYDIYSRVIYLYREQRKFALLY
jgi:hypothetical protein